MNKGAIKLIFIGILRNFYTQEDLVFVEFE